MTACSKPWTRLNDVAAVVAQQVDRLAEQAVRMHVDGLDALALDHHRQARRRRRLLRARRIEHPQLQKAIPAIAPAPLMKSLRVVMVVSSFFVFGTGTHQ